MASNSIDHSRLTAQCYLPTFTMDPFCYALARPSADATAQTTAAVRDEGVSRQIMFTLDSKPEPKVPTESALLGPARTRLSDQLGQVLLLDSCIDLARVYSEGD
jgi:hypothetical protein